MQDHDMTSVAGVAQEMLDMINAYGCDWCQALYMVTVHTGFNFEAWAMLLTKLTIHLADGGQVGPLGATMLRHVIAEETGKEVA